MFRSVASVIPRSRVPSDCPSSGNSEGTFSKPDTGNSGRMRMTLTLETTKLLDAGLRRQSAGVVTKARQRS
jgi:hypothetical protein